MIHHWKEDILGFNSNSSYCLPCGPVSYRNFCYLISLPLLNIKRYTPPNRGHYSIKGHSFLLHTIIHTFPQMPTLMCSNKDTFVVPKVSNIQNFLCILQDDLVDYHIKHERFPERMKKVIYPTSCLPDLIVLMWVCLLGVPAVFTALYLAWVGAWLTLGVILATVFVGMQLFV